LIPILKKIKFFEQLEIEDEFFGMLIEGLKYQYIQKEKVIFKKGNMGEKFYILLQGDVIVCLPKFEGK